MKNYNKSILGIMTSVAILAVSVPAYAEKDKKVNNPIGGASGWNAEVKTENAEKKEVAPPKFQLDEDTTKLAQTISNYFNEFPFLQGRFKQTNPDEQVATGKFYLKRPGKLRFDYSPPSKMRIVADGKWLSIEDHDLKTAEQYPLDSTPFKLLMSAKVNLIADARIVDITRGAGVVIMTVMDKGEDATGQLKLFFSFPEVQLLQWIITDPQGQDTKIELSEHVANKKKDDKFFEVAQFGLGLDE